jgi:hypothetical protein
LVQITHHATNKLYLFVLFFLYPFGPPPNLRSLVSAAAYEAFALGTLGARRIQGHARGPKGKPSLFPDIMRGMRVVCCAQV